MPNSTTSRMSVRIREASELRRSRSGISGSNAGTSTAATNISRLNTDVRTTARSSALASTSQNNPLPRNIASRSNRRTGIPSTLLQSGNSPGRTEQLGVRSRLTNIRNFIATEETRSAKKIDNFRKRADKQVQTDKSDELIRLPINLITKRDRSLSPAQLPCAICFNEMLPSGGRRLTSLKCGHTFCYLCVEKWYEICKACPVCMQPMNKKSFRNIYF